jgi:myo-inositol-1(or 4)-monophosphatase
MKTHQELTETLVHEVQQVIAEVASFILHERHNFDPGKVEHKGPSDLVSYVDRKSEAMLRTAFEKILPGAGFIGEESGFHDDQAEWRWIVDPLDGTTNFVHNLPIYCISVGLQHYGETLFGVIHDVPHGEVFWALKGQGAYLGSRRIHVSEVGEIKDALLGTGFPIAKLDRSSAYMAAIQELLETCHGVRRLGSAAIDMAYVACGCLDGFFEIGLKPWDVAAGSLIVREAGGAVTSIEAGGDFLFGRQIAVSNGKIQQAMLHILRKHLVR